MDPKEFPLIIKINQYLAEGVSPELEATLLKVKEELIRVYTALEVANLKQIKELEKFNNLSNRVY